MKRSSLQTRGFTFGKEISNLSKGMVWARPDVQFFGRFKSGKVNGHFWLGLLNNGYIHGVTDEHGLASGNEIAYIYPDGETALRGHFENKYMKKAKHVDVLKYGCDENGMPIAMEYTEPLSNEEFYYDPCTNESFGGGSLYIRDPYESKNAQVKQSLIPNSGAGVFLRRDVPKGKPACYYSLYLYNSNGQLQSFEKQHLYNESKSDNYRRECLKYAVDITFFEGRIALPPEEDIDPLPNIGPKVNHHFLENNAHYIEVEHPRWGLIQSVMPQSDLTSGQELFTFYGYEKFPFPKDYPWYWEAKNSIGESNETR